MTDQIKMSRRGIDDNTIARVLELWRLKMDTAAIARKLMLPEGMVAMALRIARERERSENNEA